MGDLNEEIRRELANRQDKRLIKRIAAEVSKPGPASAPVERVTRISQKAIDADVAAIAAKLDLPLRGLVARLA